MLSRELTRPFVRELSRPLGSRLYNPAFESILGSNGWLTVAGDYDGANFPNQIGSSVPDLANNGLVDLRYNQIEGSYIYLPGTVDNNLSITNNVSVAEIVISILGESDYTYADSSPTLIIGNTDANLVGKKILGIIINDGASGPKAGELNPSLFGSTLSYTDPVSGEDWTVSQSSTGLTASVVNSSTGSTWLSDGSSLYAQAASDALFGVPVGESRTFMWCGILSRQYDSTDRILSTDNGSDGVTIRPLTSPGRVGCFIRDNGVRSLTDEDNQDIKGELTSVAIVIEPSVFSLFINGDGRDTGVRPGNAIPPLMLNVFNDNVGNFQKGRFSGAAVSDKALTGAEQIQLANLIDKNNSKS